MVAAATIVVVLVVDVGSVVSAVSLCPTFKNGPSMKTTKKMRESNFGHRALP